MKDLQVENQFANLLLNSMFLKGYM